MPEPDPEPVRPPPRSRFAPVLLAGLAAGTLTAVASNRTAFALDNASGTGAGSVSPATDIDGSMPLATSLGLVFLAAWGVLLVTRGVVRRALAWLVLTASLGLVVSVGAAYLTLPDDLRGQLRASGMTSVSISPTGWFWVAAVGAVLSLGTGLIALRRVGSWPEMGTRYDAPGTTTRVDPDSNLDLWKAIEEGRDPTV
jgi:uncharacterized membrane protein (TIGR02234 family)